MCRFNHSFHFKLWISCAQFVEIFLSRSFKKWNGTSRQIYEASHLFRGMNKYQLSQMNQTETVSNLFVGPPKFDLELKHILILVVT